MGIHCHHRSHTLSPFVLPDLREDGLTKGLQRSVKPSIAAPARRAFATPVGQSSMKSTTLSNGFTIATEHAPYAQTSTVERAKAQLKASILLSLDGTTAV